MLALSIDEGLERLDTGDPTPDVGVGGGSSVKLAFELSSVFTEGTGEFGLDCDADKGEYSGGVGGVGGVGGRDRTSDADEVDLAGDADEVGGIGRASDADEVGGIGRASDADEVGGIGRASDADEVGGIGGIGGISETSGAFALTDTCDRDRCCCCLTLD